MAKFCTECGATLSDNKKFCTECGMPVQAEPQENMAAELVTDVQPAEVTPVYTEPVHQPTYQQSVQTPPPMQPTYQQPVQATPPVMPRQQTSPPVYGADVAPSKGSKYESITAGGYIGIMLLMCIPVVGIILTIIWACGGCRKVNKRSLARASLIMMAVGLVISLIMGFVLKGIVNTAIEASGLGAITSGIGESGKEEEENDPSGLLGLLGATSNGGELSNQNESTGSNSGNSNEGSGTSDSSGTSDLSELGGLLAILGGLSGEGNSNITNSDIQALEELGQMLEGLEGATGGDTSGLSGLVDGAIEANKDAEALNDGWPKTLRPYPDGTATALASYRTEISSTSKETMHQWIEDLKKDGFEYQDFYDFGMSEEDMLSMDAWWGYDGKTYLSVSYYDGVVTIDHTKELPDLESYFGG